LQEVLGGWHHNDEDVNLGGTTCVSRNLTKASLAWRKSSFQGEFWLSLGSNDKTQNDHGFLDFTYIDGAGARL
jgi:hypothetical protein